MKVLLNVGAHNAFRLKPPEDILITIIYIILKQRSHTEGMTESGFEDNSVKHLAD